MKKLVAGVLIVFGTYWLFNHYQPLPFNHESLGMSFHTVHRILGIIFFVLAGVVWKNGIRKRSSVVIWYNS